MSTHLLTLKCDRIVFVSSAKNCEKIMSAFIACDLIMTDF